MKRKPPFVICHFPHPTGWRYSWIDKDSNRQESTSFETRAEAKRKAKEHDARIKNQRSDD